jgi:hypothetical protein
MGLWNKVAVAGLVAAAAAGCDGTTAPDAGSSTPSPTALPADSLARAPFPMVADNVHHDTLLVQVTFDLLDGTYLMVAGNVEETFEGLRLFRYRLAADSTVEHLAVSAPAYDSWTMLPTFFATDSTTGSLWVLANFGEKESWGQKLMLLDKAFSDAGFMDVALPERVMEDDTLRLKRRNIAPRMRYYLHGDTALWHFACDSVYLYDDQAGQYDRVLPAQDVRYSFHRAEGLVLWVRGQKRPVKEPS